MAGSDLDGDEYFVVWREDLIFPGENEKLMDFLATTPVHFAQPLGERDIIKHLKLNIEADPKGIVCGRHLTFANTERKGIFSSKCLELADLAAQIIDAPKTGVAPVISPHLNPRLAPDNTEKEYHKPTYLGSIFWGLAPGWPIFLPPPPFLPFLLPLPSTPSPFLSLPLINGGSGI
jgi:RNA-dependent RNA polymerase